MKRVHIVGGKNHGKTTLIVELVELFRRRGIAVGTIKHTHHRHQLDSPGKDSFRHRQAGAEPSAIFSKETTLVYLAPADSEQEYERLAPLFAGCRVVLVEGHLDTRAPKIEVWRQVLGTRPVCLHHPEIRAVVTDDAVQGVPVIWKRSHLEELADRVLKL
jgi:molybdopterin-guanine dinucleotide biosynthesis protein B